MAQYMLSVHSVDSAPRSPMTEEEMQQSWATIGAIEKNLKSSGAWVYSGRLHDADTATVVRLSGSELLTTDGPFMESKEHLGGFYIIEASDLDSALGWAKRVVQAIKVPIEVRPLVDGSGA
jgi:hypothetical protein